MKKFLILTIAIIAVILLVTLFKTHPQKQASPTPDLVGTPSQASTVEQAFPANFPFPDASQIQNPNVDGPTGGVTIYSVKYDLAQSPSDISSAYKAFLEKNGYTVSVNSIGATGLQVTAYKPLTAPTASNVPESIIVTLMEKSNMTEIVAMVSKPQ